MMCKNYSQTVLLIFFFFSISSNFAQEQLAFPGAEEYGKYTVRGSGGQVYEMAT